MKGYIARTIMLCLALAVPLTGCAGRDNRAPDSQAQSPASKQIVALDYAGYASIEEMRSASDLVVLGSFVKVVRKSFEREFAIGGDPNYKGLPVVVWQFRVDQVLAGNHSGETLNIVRFDTDKIQVEDQAGVVPGEHVVLFLGRSRTGYRATIAGEQAVLDVGADGRLSPRQAAEPTLQDQVRKLENVADLMRHLQ